jgi:hypothetical protein
MKSVKGWNVEAWELKTEEAVLFNRVAVGVAIKAKRP